MLDAMKPPYEILKLNSRLFINCIDGVDDEVACRRVSERVSNLTGTLENGRGRIGSVTTTVKQCDRTIVLTQDSCPDETGARGMNTNLTSTRHI